MLGNIIVCYSQFCLTCKRISLTSIGAVCQQTVPYAEHTENFAQQSDLFAAVDAVCEQTISYAEHTEKSAQQSDLFAAVGAVCQQTIPYAEHTENAA